MADRSAAASGNATPPRASIRLRSADAAAFGALLQASPAPPPGAPTPVALPSGSGQFAVTLRGVLTPAECRAVVEATERRGYGAALLNVGGGREVYSPDDRDSARAIVDSPEFADALFARVAHALPPTIERGNASGSGGGDSGGGGGGGTMWRLVGLNERLRFLRYDAGQKFGAHYDGAFMRGPESGALAGQRTFVTLLLYLNEGYEGAFTTFCDEGGGAPERALAVAPAEGLVLMHDHKILHEVPPLVAGRKYVLRTDVLYARES